MLGIVSGEETENDGGGGEDQGLPPFPLGNSNVVKNAVEALRRDGNLNSVAKRYVITPEAEGLIRNAASAQK